MSNWHKARTTQAAEAVKVAKKKPQWNSSMVRHSPPVEDGLPPWATLAQHLSARVLGFPAGSDERRALGAAALALRVAGRHRDPADVLLRFRHLNGAVRDLAVRALQGVWPEDGQAPADD